MTETERLREQVSGSISVSGAGMASLYWDIETVIKNLFRMAAAILLGAGFLRALFTVRDIEILGNASVIFPGFCSFRIPF